MLVTIFTPTYNRVKTLPRLYQSLCRQSYKDFEWLVIDDGSTDETEELMSEYLSNSMFRIKYIKQENGGKHTAHNTALNYAKGDFFFTVDSDDWLADEAISKIKRIIDANASSIKDKSVAGLLALKAYGDNSIIGKPFTTDNFISSLYELEHNGNRGERTVILKTDIAKSFPFPTISGEKFVTESVVYDCIDQFYGFFLSNVALTVCEYQIDGLSSNPRRLMYNNPGGYAWYFIQRANASKLMIERIKYLIQAHAFTCIYNGNDRLPKVVNHRFLFGITKPCGWLAAAYYKLHSN